MGRKERDCQAKLRRLYNVSEITSSEKRAGQYMLRMKAIERVAKACQLSTSTVAMIQCEGKSGNQLKTPTSRVQID